jgi:hypothetical protein
MTDATIDRTFQGLTPSKGDLLCDRWRKAVADLFDKIAAGENIPRGEHRHRVWLVWQWLYAKLAGGNAITCPQAMIAAGLPLTAEKIDQATELLYVSERYLD